MGEISVDDAIATFKYLGKAAGEDGKLSKKEAKRAMEALSSTDDSEEIDAFIDE